MSDSEWRYFVELTSGTTERSCWVDREVKVGDMITLKNSGEPERWWKVMWVGTPRHKSLLPDSAWKVGGL